MPSEKISAFSVYSQNGQSTSKLPEKVPQSTAVKENTTSPTRTNKRLERALSVSQAMPPEETPKGGAVQENTTSPTRTNKKLGPTPSTSKALKPEVTPKESGMNTRNKSLKRPVARTSTKRAKKMAFVIHDMQETSTTNPIEVADIVVPDTASSSNQIESTRMSFPFPRHRRRESRFRADTALDDLDNLADSDHMEGEEEEETANGNCSFAANTTMSGLPYMPIVKSTPSQEEDFGRVECGNANAVKVFKWLISPLRPEHFFGQFFEKEAYHIPRTVHAYQEFFSLEDIESILKENRLFLGEHVDILEYINGERIPLDEDMTERLTPDFVWRCFQEGYTIRMRNPQAYNGNIHKICSYLQEYFGSSVGANMYLTPANTQGFPPHHDDIDAFILQILGRKHWKVYKPQDKMSRLPRFASGDLDEDDLPEPNLSVTLQPGDLLYLPRGFVHQAKCTGEFSLHITISTNRMNTYADFIAKGLPYAIESAASKNVCLREALPKDYMDHLGAIFTLNGDSTEMTPERRSFIEHLQKCLKKVFNHFPVDKTADLHAKDFLHESVPPFLSKDEIQSSISGNGNRVEKGVLKTFRGLTPKTRVRWLRKRALRLQQEGDKFELCNCFANSKNAKEEPISSFEVEPETVPAIMYLFETHPNFVPIKELPVQGDKLAFAENLYINGLLMTEKKEKKK